MKHFFEKLAVSAVSLVWWTVPLLHADEALKQPSRILMVTQSVGYQHPPVTRVDGQLSTAEQAMTELGITSGAFRVDCTQDAAKDFTKERLDGYNIVMFYTAATLPIPEDVLDYFLNDWLKQKGHGFIGAHSALYTYSDYEPYWDMLGGTFESHPWLYTDTVTVSVHDTNHPASKPWGKQFTITDEIYKTKHWQPEKVRVLMSLNIAETAKKAPYHVPVAWVKQYGQGRVFYISLGHRDDVWTNPTYMQSIFGAIQWVQGRVEGDATPNPEVSAAQQRKAEADFNAAPQ